MRKIQSQIIALLDGRWMESWEQLRVNLVECVVFNVILYIVSIQRGIAMMGELLLLFSKS